MLPPIGLRLEVGQADDAAVQRRNILRLKKVGRSTYEAPWSLILDWLALR